MSANPDAAAPTGRNKPAQGKERRDAALGHGSQNAPSPEPERSGDRPPTGDPTGATEGNQRATEESANSLLKVILAKREAGFRGRGKYHPPTAPDLEGLPEPPNGWIWASPEQLANAAPYALGIGPFGSNLKVSDYRESGTPLIFVRNIRAEDFSLVAKFVAEEKANELAAHTAEGGDILITKMGEPPGDAAFYPVGARKAVITADCIKWRLAEDLRVPKFFVYAIRSRLVQQQIQNRTRGVAQKKISLERFRDLAIPLPPLSEQRRIVAEIEKQFTRLEAGVVALRRVQANLKRYRAAVLKAACEGRLVPTEAEWPQKQIATAIETMDQGWSPKCESEPSDSDTTWAVIKTTAIQNLRFLEDENKTLPAALKPRAHLELVPGDLLVTRAGPRSRVGVACLVKSTRRRLMLCDKAYRLRCKPEVAHPAFLELVLNAPHIQDEVNKLKTGISDSGVNLTQKRFGELLVPLPPLAEQTRIVAEVERRLSVVEELESVVTANLQRATRLRQSILQKAFTGELQ